MKIRLIEVLVMAKLLKNEILIIIFSTIFFIFWFDSKKFIWNINIIFIKIFINFKLGFVCIVGTHWHTSSDNRTKTIE